MVSASWGEGAFSGNTKIKTKKSEFEITRLNFMEHFAPSNRARELTLPDS